MIYRVKGANKQTKTEYSALSGSIKTGSISRERKSIMPRAYFRGFSFLQNKMIDDKEGKEWSAENINILTQWLAHPKFKGIWEDKYNVT